MHESACSIREEKKTPRVFHSPSHFVIFYQKTKSRGEDGEGEDGTTPPLIRIQLK